MILVSSLVSTSGATTVSWKKGDQFRLLGYYSSEQKTTLKNQPSSNDYTEITLSEDYIIKNISETSKTITLSRSPYTSSKGLSWSYSKMWFESLFLTSFGLRNSLLGITYLGTLFLRSTDLYPSSGSHFWNLRLFVEPDWSGIGSYLSEQFSAEMNKIVGGTDSLSQKLTRPQTAFNFCGATKPSDIPKVLNQTRTSWDFKISTKLNDTQGVTVYFFSFDLKYRLDGRLESFSFKRSLKFSKTISVAPSLPPGNSTVTPPITSIPLSEVKSTDEVGWVSLNGNPPGSDAFSGIFRFLSGLSTLDVASLGSLVMTGGLLVILLKVRKRFPGKIKRLNDL